MTKTWHTRWLILNAHFDWVYQSSGKITRLLTMIITIMIMEQVARVKQIPSSNVSFFTRSFTLWFTKSSSTISNVFPGRATNNTRHFDFQNDLFFELVATQFLVFRQKIFTRLLKYYAAHNYRLNGSWMIHASNENYWITTSNNIQKRAVQQWRCWSTSVPGRRTLNGAQQLPELRQIIATRRGADREGAYCKGSFK